MYRKNLLSAYHFIFIVILLILTSLILHGCFGSSSNRRGSLDDAMEEASDEHKGERKVDTEPDPDYDYEDEDDGDYVYGLAETNALAEDDSLKPFTTPILTGPKLDWFTIAGGTGLVKNEDFYGFNHGNLAIGTFLEEKHYLELAVGFSWSPVQETSLLNESLDGGVNVFQIGVGYKYYLTPRHTFMGLYICGGLGYAYMRWSYKNPFQAMSYDEYGNELGYETISSDGLSGFEVYAGLGINILQTDGFQLGGEILPGAILWGGETSEGFDNDVFDNFTYSRLKIFLRFGW